MSRPYPSLFLSVDQSRLIDQCIHRRTMHFIPCSMCISFSRFNAEATHTCLLPNLNFINSTIPSCMVIIFYASSLCWKIWPISCETTTKNLHSALFLGFVDISNA